MRKSKKIGNVYESNNYGKFKVLDYGKDTRHFLVEFIETGFKTEITAANLSAGKVKDHTIRKSKHIGKKFMSNKYGEFEIIAMSSKTNYYQVRFLNTGFETESCLSQINNGDVRDYIVKPSFVGQTFKSNNYGDFEIIRKGSTSRHYIIKFKNTGFEKEVFLDSIQRGTIWDESVEDARKIYKKGMTINTDKGDVEILEVFKKGKWGHTHVQGKFLDTGFEFETTPYNIVQNRISNYLRPSVRGIGIIGYAAKYADRDTYTKEYNLWDSMIERCYCHLEDKHSTYKDVEICERWLRFDYFLEDVVKIPNYDKWKSWHLSKDKEGSCEWNLDKDIKCYNSNKKVYSLETCLFIPRSLNSKFAAYASDAIKKEIVELVNKGVYEY
ncbi:hypothetical protein ABEY43_06265 [Priestia megaterium]